MISSYEKNNYGEVIYNIVTAWRPLLAVELGVLHGYSTIAIALGLQKNKLGHLDAYDLFDDYEFKHGSQDEVQQKLTNSGAGEYATLYKANAYEVYSKYADNSVHLLHVDISNTGEVVRKIMELWDPKIVQGGSILFEGGTDERDQEEWMVKYNKEPIRPEIEKNPIINSRYVYGAYLLWPGLTHLLKRR